MAEQPRREKSEKSFGAEVLVAGMATERAQRHGVIRRKTSHGTDGRERLPGRDPSRGTGILPAAIGPDTGWKPVPHQMPYMSRSFSVISATRW